MFESIKKQISFVCLILIFISTGCSVQSASQKKLKLLILSGMNNHDWEETTPVLESLYLKSGDYKVEILQAPSKLSDQLLSEFDVVVSNWSNYPSQERVWGQRAENALINFIESGKGFVVFHASSVCFHDWKDYQKIVGATWKEDQTDHGAAHLFEVMIEDKNHPITKGMDVFQIHDELWHRMAIQSDAHILCKAFSDPKNGGSGQYEPLAFTTSLGKGRGFNLVLGHDTDAMDNPGWKQLMLQGTQWVATGKVKK